MQSEQPPAIAASDGALLGPGQAALLHRMGERGADAAIAEDRPVAADQHIVGAGQVDATSLRASRGE
jgi:hypothetical protein